MHSHKITSTLDRDLLNGRTLTSNIVINASQVAADITDGCRMIPNAEGPNPSNEQIAIAGIPVADQVVGMSRF